jgi:hypothetical protein
VKAHLHHRCSQGKDTQHEHWGVSRKGFPDHVKRQKPEEIGHQRHQDAGDPNGQGLDSEKNNRHGNNY